MKKKDIFEIGDLVVVTGDNLDDGLSPYYFIASLDLDHALLIAQRDNADTDDDWENLSFIKKVV